MDREILESFKEVTNELWEFVRDESDDPSVGIIGWNESKAKVARARGAIAQLEASQREAPVAEGETDSRALYQIAFDLEDVDAKGDWPEDISGIVDQLRFVARRLASAGLLASAPVVPDADDLEAIAYNAGSEWLHGPVDRKYQLSQRSFEAQAIRNHLLTLGYKDPS